MINPAGYNQDDWYFWVNMKSGQVTMPVFQNLEAFWPGVLTLVGDTEAALKSLHNYHQVHVYCTMYRYCTLYKVQYTGAYLYEEP